MAYETSYESGRKPFRPDPTRGYWAQPTDYILICMGLAFKRDFFIVPMIIHARTGIFAVIPYLICILLYVVPIMVLQSFMGQFSSSGYISAFRVSPLFKGIGYISLCLNFAILTYYSALVTVPLLFLSNSFKSPLPWSCEVFESKDSNWNITIIDRMSICYSNNNEMMNTTHIKKDLRVVYDLPSVNFFYSSIGYETFQEEELTFSWELFLCTLLTWVIIAGIFYKLFNAAKLGKLLRVAIWITLFLLLICVVRFMFLPGALKRIQYLALPKYDDVFLGIANALVYSVYAFGPGWGSIVSLASHNKFNRNIMRDSWLICVGQLFINILFTFNGMLVNSHFREIADKRFYNEDDFISNHFDLVLSSASAIANMSFANFWSLLYYGMLTIANLIVMVTQLYTLLVTIFDEFAYLRAHKMKVTFITIGILALFSLYLCTNQGMVDFSEFSIGSLFTHAGLNLLLLLVILWIYGRQRFQRDIEFMVHQPFATWKVHMLRFVTPLFLLVLLICGFAVIFFVNTNNMVFHALTIIFIVLPWIAIPASAIFILLQITGPWSMRFKHCCRPTDWYPVEQEDRQRYEDAMETENITHQLNEVNDEVI